MKKVASLLLIMLIFCLLMALGFWQLSRAAEKQTILQALKLQQQAAPLTNDQLPDNLIRSTYRQVKLVGKFDNSRQFLLDNRILRGQVGYEVLIPFILTNQKIILMNRGWIPKTMITLPPVQGVQTVVGMLTLYPSKIVELKASPITTLWPQIIQNLNFAKISQQFSGNLLPGIVLLDPQQKFGFIREWQIINAQPSRHIAYAVQWFALAGIWLITILLLWLRRRKRHLL